MEVYGITECRILRRLLLRRHIVELTVTFVVLFAVAFAVLPEAPVVDVIGQVDIDRVAEQLGAIGIKMNNVK